jgi:hypothetical protein
MASVDDPDLEEGVEARVGLVTLDDGFLRVLKEVHKVGVGLHERIGLKQTNNKQNAQKMQNICFILILQKNETSILPTAHGAWLMFWPVVRCHCFTIQELWCMLGSACFHNLVTHALRLQQDLIGLVHAGCSDYLHWILLLFLCVSHYRQTYMLENDVANTGLPHTHR